MLQTYKVRMTMRQHLSQLILGLYKLYNEGHPYAVSWARMLQLLHPEPVSSNLVGFIARMNQEFLKLN